MLSGKHAIAGKWLDSDVTFQNEPFDGQPDTFFDGNPELVDLAVQAADAAFPDYANTERSQRSAFLNRIAEEIDARGDKITQTAMRETGLPEARLIGERGRTTGQLKYFAALIERGDYLDRRHDAALPERAPLPRPELRLMQRPVGPVAVFGASNFPLAFSVAGGDTASALAAGCPVVVKGHPAHPGTSEIVAEAIVSAVAASGLPAGVFSLIHGRNIEVGTALVTHPSIRAVGFTGSLGAGRALFDLCAARPDPIPFFGELGSINPVFVLATAAARRADTIAKDWIASLTLGAGQFCTNPGVVVIVDGEAADRFVDAAAAALQPAPAQSMLTQGIAGSYCTGVAKIRAVEGVRGRVSHDDAQRTATGDLFEVDGDTWLANGGLSEEVFGPAGIVVRARDEDQARAIAAALHGQLTCTLQMDDADIDAAKSLVGTLEHKAGRLLVNGFPTGVEVCDAMVHGGPYPASTNFGATSVGGMAIRRFLRPVCYQNFPLDLLPGDLRA